MSTSAPGDSKKDDEAHEDSSSQSNGSSSWGAGGLSAEEAEKLAEQFRPSWEPPPPTEAPSDGENGRGAWAVGPPPEVPTEVDTSPFGMQQPPTEKPSAFAATEPAMPVAPSSRPPAPSAPPAQPARRRDATPSQPLRSRADTTGETVALPVSTVPRNMLVVGGLALTGLIVLVVFMAVSGAEPERAGRASDEVIAAEGDLAPREPSAEPAPLPTPRAAPAPAPVPRSAPVQPVAQPAAAPTPARQPPAPAPAPRAAPAPPTPAPAPAPRVAMLRARTIPPTASLFVDHHPVANPYTAQLQMGRRYLLEGKRAGFRDGRIAITLRRNEDLVVRLREIPTPGVRRAQQRRAAGRSRGAGFVTQNPY